MVLERKGIVCGHTGLTDKIVNILVEHAKFSSNSVSFSDFFQIQSVLGVILGYLIIFSVIVM